MKEQQKSTADKDNELLRQRMGFVKYYLMPWRREKERKRMARIAAINDLLENPDPSPSDDATLVVP